MGVYQFYARRYHVNSSTYLDETPQLYGFALCTYATYPSAFNFQLVPDYTYIQYPENNVLTAVMNTLAQGYTGEIRFIVTNNTSDNYFYYKRTSGISGYYVFGMITDYYTPGGSYTICQFPSDGTSSYTGQLAVFNQYVNTPTEGVYSSWFGKYTSNNNYYLYGNVGWWGGTHSSMAALLRLIGMSPGPDPTQDPYNSGGITDVGGGDGDFNNTSDNIDIPSLPTLTVSETGFITLFNPSVTELQALASYMWSNPLFDISAWKKIFADPMNAILGLSIVPVDVPSSITANVKVGNISTGITMPVASTQYVTIDCGSIQLKEFWGGYLDYSPYTKVDIYLPYCGIHPLDTDDIMTKTINVVYHIDILSGACCIYIKCDGSILYTFIGQCSSSIPITGDNWTNMVNGVISAAKSIGSMVATAGASAGKEIPNLASTAVNNMKPAIEKSGSLVGTGGLLACQKPYLIITRPRQALPDKQNRFMGYPSFLSVELSSLKGYTEVESVHLENIGATDNEIKEIETLLKSGVIF